MSAAGRPMWVLFICTANICRSAYAEVLARHLLEAPGGLGGRDAVQLASAGTHGFTGREMDPPMAEEARLRGADPGSFRSRPLTMSMVEQADVVLTAESMHRQFVLDERPELFRKIYTLGQLARTLDAVPADQPAAPGSTGRSGRPEESGRSTATQLLRGLRTSFHAPSAEDDLPDPFGRGREAASVTAAAIEGLLHRVLPRLTGVPTRTADFGAAADPERMQAP
ncbi:hypothetical protein [Nocardioides mesophilus]|uniref:Phosphotyrosine protein phosphatase I domain-containing protein n=1 Tax=Nocardioides mesophilus TaxID=433659 RepID=A0A7G9REM0_9ACTN|nr:hypothetical protein [Nocardioides mesophilus]QNN54045.1 hypothetical protein H9L09_06605 [Nocardioides mesophilus]